MMADQMIKRLKMLHNNSFIHRDMKPENFVIGVKDKRCIIYLIDFGLAKRFKNKDGSHIPYKEGKSLTGTARYASVSA
jgi:casein kinase 1